MSRYTKSQVEAMSLSERVEKANDLWENGYPRPFAPEVPHEETPESFEDKVGQQMLYLIEQLDKMPVEEHEEYLALQRQVAEERARMALEAKQWPNDVRESEVHSAANRSAEYEAAMRISQGQLSDDAPAALSSRS